MTQLNFYSYIFSFCAVLYFILIIIKGIFMIMSRFFDKENTVFHHHFHYRDHNRK